MSIIRTAPAPKRATSSVVLSAGLLNIPLSIYTSVEQTGVVRKEFFEGDPSISVGRVPVRKDTDEPIVSAQAVRMAEADNGDWVQLDNDEIVDCLGLTDSADVVSFVPVKDTGKYLTDGLYQARPKNDRKSKATSDAAFGLLLAGMKARKVHALIRFAMRGVPRHGLLTATGDLLLIATADAVREALPLPGGKPSKAEVDMVGTLIDTIGVDTPTVLDDGADKVQEYVNTKARMSGKPVDTKRAAKKLPEVIDMMAVLEASIDEAKKKKSKSAA